MNRFRALFISALLGTSSTAFATIVEFQTSKGSFQVNLFDQTTPITVKNFLRYVEQGRYSDSIIHRSLPNSVLQGGGFKYEGNIPLDKIATYAPITNEPKLSNLRGTIAMAKLPREPNSATSQWYFNVTDNSSSLDPGNGGYTVFGQVTTEEGMAVIDKISNLERCEKVPVINYTAEQCNDVDIDPDGSNLIAVNSVVIIDSDPTTADNLSPKTNTLIDTQPKPVPTPEPDESSSGSMFGGLLFMFFFLLRRYQQV
ncbi:hypothetical protein PCIT_a1122 [Pseudoalteromonas citrea]|uniref:Peptidyl-prolyl cis-trans isomerase n=2 Tax=Pseudoalteromonas citrea TaxID=43655 RepID=A0AAD4FTI6_9GAMM|nr:peptidylprolyl isomerase [Pseudoalteromonas citrea]KAF7775032.1 hypothetical protein PCIT_a1122 [Pseudoalteromonas citrea]